jgi:hypothetical protein
LISLEWASRRNERIDFSLERIRKIAETLKAEFEREQIVSKLIDSPLGASLAATAFTLCFPSFFARSQRSGGLTLCTAASNSAFDT